MPSAADCSPGQRKEARLCSFSNCLAYGPRATVPHLLPADQKELKTELTRSGLLIPVNFSVELGT
jgi:hypothetical protein